MPGPLRTAGQQDGWAAACGEGAKGSPHWAPVNPSDQKGELGKWDKKAANT